MLTDLFSGLTRSPGSRARWPWRGPEESPAEQFASWLPYSAYRPEEQLFLNLNGIGFMLEVMPQSGADERMVEVLLSLYANCPVGTGIQMSLFASPHILDQLKRYANLRVEDSNQFANSQEWGRPARNVNLFRKLARSRVEHLAHAAQVSLTQGFHYVIRDFRLMISVTVPGDPDDLNLREQIMALRDGMATTLRSANLPNLVCDAAALINWCSIFCNPDRMNRTDGPHLEYDDGRELREQIVDHDTIQDAHANCIRMWKEEAPEVLEARFFSIKSFPKRFTLWQMGSLIGDLMQPALQYNTPFLLTMGLQVLDPTATGNAVRANHIRATQNAGSKMAKVMPDVAEKALDWGAAAEAIDAGGSLVSMYHQVALFGAPAKAMRTQEAAKAIWRARGFELNADVYMHRQALLASLPMTLSPRFHADLKKMRRVTRKTISNAIHLAPLIAEWRGTRTPVMVLAGRRGQLMTYDLYDNDGNRNAAVVGAPGSGKSVLLNEMAAAYRSINAQVWMEDLGRSFEKLCKRAGGMYIEFKPDSRICMNPFSSVTEPRNGLDGQPEGGIQEDIELLKPALAKMCSMKGQLDDVQMRALGAVTMHLYGQYGRDLTITGLRDAMKDGTIKDLSLTNDQRIKDLAVMLTPYTKDGEYGRFFEGRCNIDFGNDLMVIENEELIRKPELHAVVNIIMMYQITGQMFLTRDRKKLFIIDELKQQLGDTGSDDTTMVQVVEAASRRARKYGGAIVTATQDTADYYSSVQMEASLNCADTVLLLRQKTESIEMLQRSGRITMDESKKRLLSSLRTEPGAFSEIYISSPVGEGVARLVLDPFTDLLFTNRLEDNAPLDALIASGMTIEAAIAELLRQRGHAS